MPRVGRQGTARIRLSVLLAALTLAAGPLSAERVHRDALDREVRLPDRPERVVALAPNLAEIVWLLGESERLVGRTENARHPGALTSLPSVGGMARPSLEAILALRPDLVLATTEGNDPGIALRLGELGVPVFVVDRDSAGMEGVWLAVCQTAAALGVEETAAHLVTEGKRRLSEYRLAAPEPKPRALLLVWTKPAVAAGPGTYVSDLLVAAGAVNAAESLRLDWPQLGREGIIALRPDLILVADAMTGGPPPGIEDLQNLPGIDARVVRVPGDPLLRPSPAALGAVEHLRRAIGQE